MQKRYHLPRELGRTGAFYYRHTKAGFGIFSAHARRLEHTYAIRPSPVMNEAGTDYSAWSQPDLIQRVTDLEKQLKELTARHPIKACNPSPTKRRHPAKVLDPSKYSTRFIALKLAYLGQKYNGFEHHANNKTPLPTVEEELWKALKKAHLIFPTTGGNEVSWDGCDYSKCGRTDRGVNAFGQVIGIRVRSNRPLFVPSTNDALSIGPKYEDGGSLKLESAEATVEETAAESFPHLLEAPEHHDTQRKPSPVFDPIADELPYTTILNRLLPPDIRILAWCPNPPPGFSARFSCKERRYRYFFTQPAFSPVPAQIDSHKTASTTDERALRDGWLDIDAMREAARHFVGLHDFQNLCKVDGSKQLTNFRRRVFHADIEEFDSSISPVEYVNGLGCDGDGDRLGQNPQSSVTKVYTFTVHGSSFLWHQVRCMVAILFLVGQRLEDPSIVRQLLDIKQCPARPRYEMASDAPLVLWDCIFPKAGQDERVDGLEWVYIGQEAGTSENDTVHTGKDAKWGSGGVIHGLWAVWRSRKMDEMLAGALLQLVALQGGRGRAPITRRTGASSRTSQKLFNGGDGPRRVGSYTPVMELARFDQVEVINEKFAKRKGWESGEGGRGRQWKMATQDGDRQILHHG
ncbi:MAG: hypothetical protein M1817_001912 [Caeruleum heppii]|nr:MAG: hypothetical protein M1817_001912 [Caeruleum heppii]